MVFLESRSTVLHFSRSSPARTKLRRKLAREEAEKSDPVIAALLASSKLALKRPAEKDLIDFEPTAKK
ncbi:hypothetical protein CYMTET_23077 [Cymbomonas tetramitiformis]|uniref:Uncharacterized protein n=1 Tax=Cymbomonas tetramitiformis TaxID=36881 RepID=A0AAE0FYZ3_9CHLO|nr:hypothetical protein CYMTET_23077 [Cymbomonas tetramitiformis]